MSRQAASARAFIATALALALAGPARAAESPLRDGQYCRYSFEQIGVTLAHTGGPPYLGIVRIDKLERPLDHVVGWLYHDSAGSLFVQANPRMPVSIRDALKLRFTNHPFSDVYSSTVRVSRTALAANGLHVVGCSDRDALTLGSQYEAARRTYGIAR